MTTTFHPALSTTWGRLAKVGEQLARPAFAADLDGTALADTPSLAVGLRRSYGDSATCRGGHVLDMAGLDRLIAYDSARQTLTAEAGLSLDALMRWSVPRGLFPKTSPGTKFVTLGGAIANDIHGKNHHSAGSFGCAVEALTLHHGALGRITLSAKDHPDLFAATIGGMGLTGVILDATIALQAIASSDLEVETVPFGHLDEFWALNEASVQTHEHTVAWIDCLAGGSSLGRGLYQRANWAKDGPLEPHSAQVKLTVPFNAPGWLLNRLTILGYNQFHYWQGGRQRGPRRMPFAAVFHPLDAIGAWNRLYGAKGFYQYQCVVPEGARAAIHELLDSIARAGEGSFLAVLKSFGSKASPGLMSFPMPGYTLALDFPQRGASTLALLDRLDQIVAKANGRLYPAKDARMPAWLFRQGYPNLARFEDLVDPNLVSDFWRRMRAA